MFDHEGERENVSQIDSGVVRCAAGRILRILRQEDSDAKPSGLGRLRRSFVRQGFRRAEPLQGVGFLHGIERRTRRQTARRQLGQLRRDLSVE